MPQRSAANCRRGPVPWGTTSGHVVVPGLVGVTEHVSILPRRLAVLLCRGVVAEYPTGLSRTVPRPPLGPGIR